MKTAFLFPGQGSQYVGMGRDLAASVPEVRDIFAEADRLLGLELSHLAFHGPGEKLMLTEYAQPAILTVSCALYGLLEREGITPDYAAGHSLGEYSALVCAGSLSFAEGLTLVRRRGLLMEEAVPAGQGTMAAVLGGDPAKVEEICRQVADDGVVEIANVNSPGQIVISGAKAGVLAAIEAVRKNGARKVIPLAVSGPFHSSLMRPAAEVFDRALAQVHFDDPGVPIVSNVGARVVATGGDVKDLLRRQIYSRVEWEASMRVLLSKGVKRFIEVGPGRVLSGLMKKIDARAKIFNVEDGPSLGKLLQRLGKDN